MAPRSLADRNFEAEALPSYLAGRHSLAGRETRGLSINSTAVSHAPVNQTTWLGSSRHLPAFWRTAVEESDPSDRVLPGSIPPVGDGGNARRAPVRREDRHASRVGCRRLGSLRDGRHRHDRACGSRVAIVQLKDARDVRWEQALPYVAGYLDPDPTDPKIIYLTIKNFGATIAENLELEITPEAERSSGVGGGTLNLPKTMPALVPGQEWRTFWDFSVYRHQEQMLKRHTLVISYADSRGARHSMDSVLDWESYTLGRRWIGRKSIHHVGESVAKIEKSIGKLAKTAAGLGGPSHPDPAGFFGTLRQRRQPPLRISPSWISTLNPKPSRTTA